MSNRFQEICALLAQGTRNGSVVWEAMDSFGMYSNYSTRLGDNIFTIGVTGSLRRTNEAEANTRMSKVRLGVLQDNGDEVDSVTAGAHDGDAYSELLGLWNCARDQRESMQNDRLRSVAEALRATVGIGTVDR